MKAFVRKVVEGNGISPPEVCQEAFNECFPDALNVEWFTREGAYEAIFYKHNLEHIAIFSFDGTLKEYKRNLPFDFLPGAFMDIIRPKGEIMNVVMINKGSTLEYEIIVQDGSLNRHMVLLTETGEVKEAKVL